jgi:hypothetical protein
MYPLALESIEVLLKSGGNIANISHNYHRQLNVLSMCCIYYFQHMLQAQAERPVQCTSYPPLTHPPPTLPFLLRTQEIHPCFVLLT